MGRIGRLGAAATAVLLVLAGLVGAVAVPTPAGADVAGYGGDDGLATGWYANQNALGPDAVTSADFGQLWSTTVGGQVYAQPVISQGTVLVATEDDNIYGLDQQTGAIRWSRNVHATPWHTADVQCPDVNPNMGITGTPVIDRATNTAYFLAKTYATGSSGPAAWFMHAVDVATGTERPGFPVPIVGHASNIPSLAFDPTQQAQRPGLLLLGGVVYVAFGGQCTRFPYQGWIVGVTTSGVLRTMWATTDPSAQQFGGGIWQSGGGLFSDRPGSLVFATGNGTTPSVPTPGTTPPNAGLGVSVVRLTVQPDGSLRPTDFFAPRNAPQLADGDVDLGSGAPLALPPSSFGTPTHPRLIVQVGKDGNVFLLDADDLGGFRQGPGGGDDVVGRFGPDGGVWSKPTPWGGDGGYVYIPTAAPGPAAQGSTGVLHAYRYAVDAGGKPTLSLVGTAAETLSFGSGPTVVTSSGTTSGTAVVWQVQRTTNGSGSLVAYDPVPSGGALEVLRSFPLGQTMKFTVPAVDAGRLFVGANGRVMAFGRPAAPLNVTPPTVAPTVVGSTTNLTVSFTATKPTTITQASVIGDAQPGAFALAGAPTPPNGTVVPTGSTASYPISFTPSAVGSASATLTVTTDQGVVTVRLNGNGLAPTAQLSVDPASIAFGSIATGTSRSASITLTNVGAQPLTFNGVTAPSTPFSASGAPAPGTTLASGASFAVTLSFAPTALATSTDQLVLNTNGGNVSVALSGTGSNPPALSVSPATIAFPATPVGGWSEATFTVSNTGGSDLTIVQSKPPLGGAFSAITSLPEGTRIGPGQSVVQRVRFAPTATGSYNGAWDIGTDSGTGEFSIDLTGAGTPNTGIPAPTAGGWIYQGAASQQGSSTVLTPPVQSTAGTAFWPQGIDPIGVRASFDLTVEAGTTPSADGSTFALVPASSGTEGTGAIGGGFGWYGLGGVAVVFNEYQANTVSVRTTSGTVQTASIASLVGRTTHVDVTLAAGNVKVSVGGTQVLNANVTLPALARLGFTAATGFYTARHLISNVSFTGVTTPVPVLSATPASLAFGDVNVGTTSTFGLNVTNTGNAPLTISSTTAPTAPFAASLPANGTTVAVGASLTVPVTFNPTTASNQSSSISIITNGGSATIPVTGRGVTPTGTVLPTPWSGTGWSINGNASVSGSSAILTPNIGNAAGNAVTTATYPFDGLRAAFDLTIDQGTGADGACFALVPGSTPATRLGAAGGGMGWAGLRGNAICFDTYQNGTEPSSNFVGLRTDAGYTATSTAIPTLRGATTHVDVSVTGTTITVRVAGVQVLTGTLNNTIGRLVFSGGTGGLTNRHLVANVSITVGAAPAPVLSVAPASIPFGSVTVGQTATSSVTVSNTGNAPMTISSTSAPAAPFGATPPANGTTVAAGGSITVPVTFTPTVATTSTGSLGITTNAGSFVVALSGTGTPAPAPVLSVAPTSVAFGNVAVGQTGSSSVTVSNTGNAPLTISSTTAPAAPFGATLPANGTVIAAGASITVPVVYAPSATVASTGSLGFTTNGGNQTVTFSGTGVPAPAPVLSVTPTSIAFGNVAVGQTGSSSVTVSNTGNAPLTISSTTAPSAPFGATRPANGTVVAAGASITVPVTYAPTSTTASSGSFAFTTNGGNQTVTLSGTGTNGTAVPAPYSGTGWTLNGSASVSGSSVILTPSQAEVAGNVVTNTTYSLAALNVAFDLTIDQGTGADGACFAMVPSATPATRLGTIGGGMGWSGMNGTAVCFDTYLNGAEPSSNFVGLRTNAGYVATSTAIPALRNNTVHVLVTTTGTAIVVRVNGTQVLTGTRTAGSTGRLVFSAGTGGLTDRHTVSAVTITA